MAGCREGVRICRNLFLSKGFLKIALIFIAIYLNAPTTCGQSGFLSIDCGSTKRNYTEYSLEWITDNGSYMDIGNSIQQPTFDSSLDPLGYGQPLLSYRYFPAVGYAEARTKYCYELQIPDNQYAYLLRVGFYMNSSMLNAARPFEFMVAVDATNWFTLTSGDESTTTEVFYVQEGIFHPPQSVMNVCLQPVVGQAFISSLELRQLNAAKLYSYPGGSSQYLSNVNRFNIGPTQWTPAVRYPDDQYDRIWSTALYSGSGIEYSTLVPPPDNTPREEAYYVPPAVMQDAWLFPNNLDWGLYWPLYQDGSLLYMNPAEYFFVVVYAERLNTSDPPSFNMSVGFDFTVSDAALNVTNLATALVHPYYILGGNFLVFSAGTTADLDYVPMNALEIYGQYSYNFSTTFSDDVAIINALKAGFSLTDWRGDPCTPVPNDWLSCNLSKPILGNLQQPCGFDKSSVKQCPKSDVDLHSKYYVTSVNISNCPISDFSGVTQQQRLSSLQELSITNCGVDNVTFQFLLNYSSQGLNILDFSYNNVTGVVSAFENAPFIQSLQYLNLSHNALTALPTTWRNTTQTLEVLDLSYNQLHGSVSSLDKLVEINNGSLQEIYMSNNQLSGTFSSDLYFSSLPNLLIANFDGNLIQGILNLTRWYDALQEATTNLSTSNVTLQLFSFVNNNISSILPSAEEFDAAIRNLITSTSASFYRNGILLGGNPYCNNPTSYIHQYLCRSRVDEFINEADSKHNTYILAISITSGVLGLLFFCVVVVTLWKLWKQAYTLREIQQALADRKVQPPFYEYSDLKTATRDFHKDNKLGHGGFGIVYKATLADGTQLAVKTLFNSQKLQVLDEFLNEVVLVTGIKHRNLVQLKGCCIKEKQRMLIYEYAEKGNLAEALWGSQAHGSLNWTQRFRICVGVARGLSYLHEELQPSIIHRDIKPENILLDKNFNPKIADFGLARHISEEASKAYTLLAGTVGYFAPEYVMKGQLSEKVDVYSYGILILIVVSGRKCINMLRSPEEQFLKDWVTIMWKKDLLFDILEPELRQHCVTEEVIRAIKIGLLCVQHEPKLRPTMSQVVTMFLGSMNIEVVPDKFDNIQSNYSQILSTFDLDIDYPTLQVIEEDSSVLPLLGLDSQSSFSYNGRSSNSQAQIELSIISGR